VSTPRYSVNDFSAINAKLAEIVKETSEALLGKPLGEQAVEPDTSADIVWTDVYGYPCGYKTAERKPTWFWGGIRDPA
jgi:hypothetical protein